VTAGRELPLGAVYGGDGRTSFNVWAPRAQRVEVRLVAPREALVPLERDALGYHTGRLEDAPPGTRYLYRLDGATERPDPATRLQPDGVHAASEVVDPRFAWRAAPPALALRDYVIYEIHVGTFTPAGTFATIVARLDALEELGVTAIELMPVAQFPGKRNWGYDGVNPFAVHAAYGGPDELKRLVDECHQRGLAVVLDVVYNHLGPEGNYLAAYAPYFTDRYRTPWGEAVNFDGPGSDEVRRYFVDHALEVVTDFRVDALRLDAVHAIVDPSARPFLEELADAVHRRGAELGRTIPVIGESDRNDPRLAVPPERGGVGLDALWNDDFHHALHALLTGERRGYYEDFGTVDQLGRAMREGFVYAGERSRFRQRRHGRPSTELQAHQLVVFAQNHDQVGNRPRGARLSGLVSFEQLKLAAGVVLLAPGVPLLFMGEEYGEPAPFPYFVSHGDPDLLAAVRRGRREEFAGLMGAEEPPDPGDEGTFRSAVLDFELRRHEPHRALWELHRELLRLRRTLPELARGDTRQLVALTLAGHDALVVRRSDGGVRTAVIYHFGAAAKTVPAPLPAGHWRRLLDSADEQWLGPGAVSPAEVESSETAQLRVGPTSFVVYRSEGP
jgi:maltooligosyltrehalose trehalohydrolase